MVLIVLATPIVYAQLHRHNQGAKETKPRISYQAKYKRSFCADDFSDCFLSILFLTLDFTDFFVIINFDQQNFAKVFISCIVNCEVAGKAISCN